MCRTACTRKLVDDIKASEKPLLSPQDSNGMTKLLLFPSTRLSSLVPAASRAEDNGMASAPVQNFVRTVRQWQHSCRII